MHRRFVLHGLIFAVVALLLGGCAYYNTFYNAKRRFAEAERSQRSQTEQSTPANPASPRQGTSGGPGGNVQSADKYRKVIETCSKLLEYYPRSRWVDDALLLMGVSYYRLGDLGRAERKFSELITLFPRSRHVPDAVLWRTRTLTEEKNRIGAIELLQSSLVKMKASAQQAAALLQLGDLYYDLQRWPEAADQYRALTEVKLRAYDRSHAFYRYGLARYAQGRNEDARDAFAVAVRGGGDAAETYDSFIHLARCEAALGNLDQAEAALAQVASDGRLAGFADGVPLERAHLAVEAGRIKDAVALYEECIATQEEGEQRGLAFYRLALVCRDELADLPRAKALLDSVVVSGAQKETVDSARAALDQISQGLLALERIRTLQEQIAERQQQDSGASAPEPDLQPVSPDSGSSTLMDTMETVPADTVVSTDMGLSADRGGVEDTLVSVPADSAIASDLGMDTTSSIVDEHASPATQAADSIVRALRERMASMPDSAVEDTVAASIVADTTSAPGGAQQPVVPPQPQADLSSLKQQLQRTYLHVAEFYQYSLSDSDSALTYYRLAASGADDPEVFWKANLFVARALHQNGGAPVGETADRYLAVVEADSAPPEAANIAREALGLPLVPVGDSPQRAALRAAEIARDSALVTPDSLLALYSAVIALDSASSEGVTALLAKAHLHETALHQNDSARVIYEYVIELDLSPEMGVWLHRRVSPPDSESVFLISDAQLFGVRSRTESLAEPDSGKTGWPPPEESLRGRRYR